MPLDANVVTTGASSSASSNAGLDAFSRLRVSEPQTIFDSKQIFDNENAFFDTLTASGGTVVYTNARASSLLSVDATASSRAVRQTKRYFDYQPGKSQLFFITFVMTGGGSTNRQKRVGCFDDNNGLFFQLDGTTLQFVRRSNTSGAPVDDIVNQAAWNIDRLDGTGPSGKTIDISTSQILIVEYQWLGVGRVRMGFDIDGQAIFCHEFLNANNLTVVYMQTSNVPIRWEILNTAGAAGTDSLESICGSVSSEGGLDPFGSQRSADRGRTNPVTVSTAQLPIISIRLKAAYNRATIFPVGFNLLNDGAGDIYYRLELNPNYLAATGFVWVSVPDSPVEYDVSNAAAIDTNPATAQGLIIDSGYFSSTNQGGNSNVAVSSRRLTLASDIAGVSDILVLSACNATAAANEDIHGSIQWLQL